MEQGRRVNHGRERERERERREDMKGKRQER